jgi:hypothetical protein
MMSKYSTALGKSFAFDSKDVSGLCIFRYFDGDIAVWMSDFILCSEHQVMDRDIKCCINIVTLTSP